QYGQGVGRQDRGRKPRALSPAPASRSATRLSAEASEARPTTIAPGLERENARTEVAPNASEEPRRPVGSLPPSKPPTGPAPPRRPVCAPGDVLSHCIADRLLKGEGPWDSLPGCDTGPPTAPAGRRAGPRGPPAGHGSRRSRTGCARATSL